jgi:hypothetical protein
VPMTVGAKFCANNFVRICDNDMPRGGTLRMRLPS